MVGEWVVSWSSFSIWFRITGYRGTVSLGHRHRGREMGVLTPPLVIWFAAMILPTAVLDLRSARSDMIRPVSESELTPTATRLGGTPGRWSGGFPCCRPSPRAQGRPHSSRPSFLSINLLYPPCGSQPWVLTLQYGPGRVITHSPASLAASKSRWRFLPEVSKSKTPREAE